MRHHNVKMKPTHLFSSVVFFAELVCLLFGIMTEILFDISTEILIYFSAVLTDIIFIQELYSPVSQ